MLSMFEILKQNFLERATKLGAKHYLDISIVVVINVKRWICSQTWKYKALRGDGEQQQEGAPECKHSLGGKD